MRIAINVPWSRQAQTALADGTVFINHYDSSADWVVDIASFLRTELFSELSRQYPKEKRIWAATEPTAYLRLNSEMLETISNWYGHVFAWHQQLQRLPQYRLWHMGTSWVQWEPGPPKFGVGAIFSGKANSGNPMHPNYPGYDLRARIAEKANEITIPKAIFNGSNPRLPTKQPALEWMFHLAVENVEEPGYFSEKLIDCFICRSIPIYWGDPMINSVFASEGIIPLDPQDFVEQCNSLTPELYARKKEAIEENFRRAQRYRSLEDNLAASIREMT